MIIGEKILLAVKECVKILLFKLFGVFPINNNKIVATTMRGRKYGDNPQYIVEHIKKKYPQADVVWLTAKGYECNAPSWIRKVPYAFNLKMLYELCTAKIWIDTHRLRTCVVKRKKQVFVETWHGGLGIKKIEGDIKRVADSSWEMKEISTTTKYADVFISNSDHLTKIYRRAFKYQGPILKCGYPKNDMLVNNNIVIEKKKLFNISEQTKIALYAPTYRERFAWGDNDDFSVYDINFIKLKEALKKRFGGDWVIFVKWHPTMIPYIQNKGIHLDGVTDLTSFNDMQSLLCVINVIISDYSSCLFDAALREIPCFTFATDFEEYKSKQGTYFEMEELPFPYAKNNEELFNNIIAFDYQEFLKKWHQFKIITGLHETGHATEDISSKIVELMKGKIIDWN